MTLIQLSLLNQRCLFLLKKLKQIIKIKPNIQNSILWIKYWTPKYYYLSAPNLVISPIVNSQPSFIGFRSDHRVFDTPVHCLREGIKHKFCITWIKKKKLYSYGVKYASRRGSELKGTVLIKVYFLASFLRAQDWTLTVQVLSSV